MAKRKLNADSPVEESRLTQPVPVMLSLLAAGFVLIPAVQAQDSNEILEEIVVVAERLRADSVQDVPASITAIGADAMERQQIENTSDMQLTVPNVSYSKGNFTTSSFQVRGIGSSAVGSTADSGVSVHVNEIPIESHRLYAAEFYDVETISIMRGPQGTLFGRNATGGLINMRTKKPDPTFNASFEAEVGDYKQPALQGPHKPCRWLTLSARASPQSRRSATATQPTCTPVATSMVATCMRLAAPCAGSRATARPST